ncbi:MAG: FAD:protein FMN transferase [Bryobacteraceae bacterium]
MYFTELLLAAALSRFEAVEPHMGTLFRVTVYAESPEQARNGFQAAFARARELDERMSDYREDSELNRLCRAAGGQASTDLAAILRQATEIARESGGAFDVTAGPVVRLWRAARRARRVPGADEIESARRLVDWRSVRVDRTGRVRLRPGMQLDLGGIAKGYAADQMLLALERAGIARALVAASGDLAASGGPPGTRGWRIGIEGLDETMALVHAAISTSGDDEQGFDAEGVRYSHIVDPRTGMALRNSRKVTVIARRGWRADALATALSVSGPGSYRARRGERVIFHAGRN